MPHVGKQGEELTGTLADYVCVNTYASCPLAIDLLLYNLFLFVAYIHLMNRLSFP